MSAAPQGVPQNIWDTFHNKKATAAATRDAAIQAALDAKSSQAWLSVFDPLRNVAKANAQTCFSVWLQNQTPPPLSAARVQQRQTCNDAARAEMSTQRGLNSNIQAWLTATQNLAQNDINAANSQYSEDVAEAVDWFLTVMNTIDPGNWTDPNMPIL